MRAWRQKLHSERGASVMIALAFLLLCAMAAGSVIAAAGADAGRVRDQKQNYQDYLTTSSAARIVRAELEGLVFTAEEKADGSIEFSDSGSGVLAAAVCALAQDVYVYGESEPTSLTLTLDGTELTAQGSLAVEDNYDVVVTLFATRGEQALAPLTLRLSAQVMDSQRTEPGEPQTVIDPETGTQDVVATEVTIDVTDVIWSVGRMERGTAG